MKIIKWYIYWKFMFQHNAWDSKCALQCLFSDICLACLTMTTVLFIIRANHWSTFVVTTWFLFASVSWGFFSDWEPKTTSLCHKFQPLNSKTNFLIWFSECKNNAMWVKIPKTIYFKILKDDTNKCSESVIDVQGT